MNAAVLIMLASFAPPALAFQGTFLPGVTSDEIPAPRRAAPAMTKPVAQPAPIAKPASAPAANSAPTPAARPPAPAAKPMIPAPRPASPRAVVPVQPAARPAAPAPAAPPIARPTTPAALTPPPPAPAPSARAPEPPPVKKTTPACSGATADIKEMIDATIATNIFNVTWNEDHPLVGGSAKFRIFDDHGGAQIEMINSSGQSVGTSPARVCVVGKTLRVALQTARLNFGSNFFLGDLNSKIRELLQTNTKQTAELPLIVSAGPKGLIHIADGFDRGKQINSTFSAR